MNPTESVCCEADRIVSTDRVGSYGSPLVDFTTTGRLWAAILDVPRVTPDQVALCMIAVKISREARRHKRDNLVDIAGYAKCLDMLVEEREQIAEQGGP